MKPARVWAKLEILKYHRWLGLLVGLFVLLQAITGSLIAFRYEFNRALHPAAMIVPKTLHPAPLAVLIKAAERALPGTKLTRIDYPRHADDAYIARLADKSGRLAIATLNPAGHVTRAASLAGWPVEYAYQVHIGLLYGGEPLVGFVGVAILLMAITGLWFWWPTRGRFRQALRADFSSPARATRGLHRVAGACLSALLMVMAVTGLAMAWADWVRPVIGVFASMVPDAAPKTPKAACAKPLPIDRDVAAAQSVRPGESIKSVRLQAKGRIVAVYFQSPISFPTRVTDHVWTDACTARVLAINDQSVAGPGNWIFNWLLPIHSGDWLGWPTRLVAWVTALGLLVMGITGYILWPIRLAQTRRAKRRRQIADSQP